MKKIYIILSYSGTMPAKVIRLFTKYEYAHTSLAINKTLKKMYSFGRRTVNNPLNGGFIIENINGEFYEKFNNTYIRVHELEIPYFKYMKLKNYLHKYEKNPENYDYDMLGFFTKIINLNIKRKDKYVCSQFVGEALSETNIHDFGKPAEQIRPLDFSELPYKIVYEGSLKEYNYKRI